MVLIQYAGYAEAGRCMECRKDDKEVFSLAFGEDGVDGAFCRPCLLKQLRSHAKSAAKPVHSESPSNNVVARS